LFTYPVLFEKCNRMADLTKAALCRVDAKRDMNILGISSKDDVTRTAVRADFRSASTLKLFDEHVYYRVLEVFEEAVRRDMTATSQAFGEEAVYALFTLKGVAPKTMVEIAEILHPQPKVVLGQVLAFPGRTV